MILYIHGFGSSGEGAKAKVLREHYMKIGEKFLAPSLSYIPELAIKTLEEIISTCKDVKLIGSSLGGYYSLYLSQKYNLKAVAINPALFPYEILKTVIGHAPNYFDDSYFSWQENHIEMLKKYDVKEVSEDMLFLLQKGDELLDYKDTEKKYTNPNVDIEEGGSHSYEDISSKFELIDGFLLD